MNYETAMSALKNRPRKKLAKATWLEKQDNGDIKIKHWNTDIIVFHSDNSVTLDTRGFHTVTTAKRLNDFVDGISISQRKRIWYLRYAGQEYIFADGMRVLSNGEVENAGNKDTEKESKRLVKACKEYAKGFVLALKNGEIPTPSGGDCWYCCMRSVDDNTPWGELSGNTSHIYSHIEEKYYVPSLLVRVIEIMPCSSTMKMVAFSKWQDGNVPTYYGSLDFAWKQIETVIERYCLRQLGLAS